MTKLVQLIMNSSAADGFLVVYANQLSAQNFGTAILLGREKAPFFKRGGLDVNDRQR